MKHDLFDRDWQYLPVDSAAHPYESFSVDDVLQEMVSEDLVPKFRAWVHGPYVILGLHDARLPYLHDGLKYLEDSGYDFIVRNSGGLGVVLDEGVLNVSLILNKEDAPTIEDGYELMLELTQRAFDGADIRAYEIEHSYCSGSYDLSIGGRKFAGISQRRIRQGAAVQIYVCVTGSGAGRAEIMRGFYHHAKKGDITKFTYPEIHPEVMASLNELLGTDFTVDDALSRMLGVIQGDKTYHAGLDPRGKERFEAFMSRMKKRNGKIRHDKDEELFPDL